MVNLDVWLDLANILIVNNISFLFTSNFLGLYIA